MCLIPGFQAYSLLLLSYREDFASISQQRFPSALLLKPERCKGESAQGFLLQLRCEDVPP